MTKADIKRTEEFLDERYAIVCMSKNRVADDCYYKGATYAVFMMGYDWTRDKNGKHKLFKR